MTKQKKIAIFTALVALYVYIWIDGGTIGHYLVLCSVGATAIFLALKWLASFSK